MPYPFGFVSISSRSARLLLFLLARTAEAEMASELREEAHRPAETSDQRRLGAQAFPFLATFSWERKTYVCQ